MNLDEYLWKNKITSKEFSEKMHCCRSYLSLIKTGKVKPSYRFAKDIVEMTDGKVTLEEIMSCSK